MVSVHFHLLFLVYICLFNIVVCEEEKQESKSESDVLSRTKRGGLNMLRLGRGLQMLRMGKRSTYPDSPMPNNLDVDSTRQLIYDILLNLESEGQVAPVYLEQEYPEYTPHFRYRRSITEYPEQEKDIPDLGKLKEGGEEELKAEEEMYPEEYPVYADVDDSVQYDKRPMNMLRLGKRPMNMLRLGKRPMNMLRLGKRPMNMLRLGKRPMNMLRLGKRPMNMLRLGKRPMNMLRLGKRPMNMLRLGKRPMNMLRLGKRPMNMLRLGKRPMNMLRLGKRPMNMLRLGKKSDEDHSLETRKINMLRLGRSNDQ